MRAGGRARRAAEEFHVDTTCISSAVLSDKNFKYVFRPQASGDQFGMMTVDFIAQNAKENCPVSKALAGTTITLEAELLD